MILKWYFNGKTIFQWIPPSKPKVRDISKDIHCIYRHQMSLQTSSVSTDIKGLCRHQMSLQTSNVSKDIKCLCKHHMYLVLFQWSLEMNFKIFQDVFSPSFNFANHVQLLILLKMSWICLIRDKKRTNAENVCIFAYGSSQSKE